MWLGASHDRHSHLAARLPAWGFGPPRHGATYTQSPAGHRRLRVLPGELHRGCVEARVFAIYERFFSISFRLVDT